MATFNASITDDNDDGFDNGSAWLIHVNNYLGSDAFTIQDNPLTLFQGGVRFRNVTIPQGATINTATITLRTKVSLAGISQMQVFGDDVDDAALWSDTSRPASGFTDTTGGTVNSSLPGADTVFTMECAACIQDIVDRGGWSSNNSMRFRLFPTDTYSTGSILDLDGGHTDEAQLDIDYTVASGISLVVNNLTQSQTIDQPSLTQQNILSTNDLDQSQTIDQPALTQANILSTNDLNQSQSIDSPVLTQAHILNVDSVTQSQAIDNITLSVAGALSVNGLTQAQTLDLSNIIQSHILLVNGLSQTQTLDQPDLSTGINITVNDLNQAQNIDQSLLIQANVLSVDSLTQSQILDNVASGAIIIGFHKGEVLVFSAYNGIITSTNAHTGEVKVFNAVDIT